ncbi:hypothetical protein HanRHA438_Chr11g0529291 [Helianthus annuus]|nr:hypothetical protein HanRHA438_Chr11g0529291 [Helianthus annuus]
MGYVRLYIAQLFNERCTPLFDYQNRSFTFSFLLCIYLVSLSVYIGACIQHLVSEPRAREEGEGRFESRFRERGVARRCGENAAGKRVVRDSRWLFGTVLQR